MLDDNQVNSAARELASNGFVRVVGAIPTTLRKELSASIETAARRGDLPAHFFPDGTISSVHEVWRAFPSYAQFIRTTPIRRIAERLFGSPLSDTIYDASFFPKKARTGAASELHQDNGFLQLSPPEGMTCWFPLDDVDESGAPLVYVPGSHRLGTLAHVPIGFGKVALAPEHAERFTRDQIVTAPCSAGDCLLHLIETVHGSAPNISNGWRRGVNFTIATERAIKPTTPVPNRPSPLSGERDGATRSCH